MHKTRSALFVLRRRDPSQHWCQRPYSHFSSGLFNSARFVQEMLRDSGVRAGLVEVTDGNDVDREVTKFDPQYVILEAIWCPPYKLKELVGLHRHRHRGWIVRNHSEMPFLAMEGISLGWLLEYAATPHTTIGSNSPVACEDLNGLLEARGLGPTLLLPNFYPLPAKAPEKREGPPGAPLDVACFGAIRPLKNHVEQALAAVLLGRRLDRGIRFHINATRIEGNADPILKTLRSIFTGTPGCQLVEHNWMDHSDFIRLCSRMELGMQVSFSETFNIVSADLVAHGVPVVGSSEIPWLPESYQADPHDSVEIAHVARKALRSGLREEFRHLRIYCQTSKETWLETLFPEP